MQINSSRRSAEESDLRKTSVDDDFIINSQILTFTGMQINSRRRSADERDVRKTLVEDLRRR